MGHLIFLGDKGGTGKTLCAEIARDAFLSKFDRYPQMVELETTARLATRLPETHTILVEAPSPTALYKNPDLAYRGFDELAQHLLGDKDTIVTFGANLTTPFLAWSAMSGRSLLGDGADITFAVVLTMNKEALTSGWENLWDLNQSFPKARRVAVLNEVVADFIPGDRLIERRLRGRR